MLLVTSNLEQYAEDVARLLNEGKPQEAAQAAKNLSARRCSRVLNEAPLPAILEFLQALGWERAANVVRYLPPPFAARLLNELDEASAVALVASLPPQNVAHLIPSLTAERAEALLGQLDPSFRAEVDQLGRFEEHSAGAYMSPYFVAVEQSMLVRDAVEAVREAATESQSSAYVYVVNKKGKPVGVISLRDLLLAKPESAIEEVMHDDVLAVRAGDEAIAAARRIRSRRFKMLPVVSEQDVLIGVITIDTAVELLAQDIADEFVAVNAASVDESFFTPPAQSVRMRLPWMMANIFLNLGAVWVISSFEDTIVQVAILAAFLPMITDMGGNVGIQALSVSIRSMALGEARLRDIWKSLRKEAMVGLCNGLALGVLFGVVSYIFQGNWILSLVAGTALAMNVLVAGIVGGTIPFLIKRLGKDPAMMTGPVLTTITDITGVSIYLGLSTLFLAGLIAAGV